ncbi:hypothetical protein FRC00_006962 [Tulasnella sp. 408]|nr:hypothetical protein FRC00_006962 [Tulasnella sp. 408]
MEYTEQVVEFMHNHHEAEEEIMFPAVESKYGPGSPQFFFANGDAVQAPWLPMMPPQLLTKIKADLWAIHSDWWSFGSTNKDMAIKPEFFKYEPALEKDRADRSEA